MYYKKMLLNIFTITDLTRQDNTTNHYKNLTIITVNVNGLFKTIQDHKFSNVSKIKKQKKIMLQEVHPNSEITKEWQKKWKGHSF